MPDCSFPPAGPADDSSPPSSVLFAATTAALPSPTPCMCPCLVPDTCATPFISWCSDPVFGGRLTPARGAEEARLGFWCPGSPSRDSFAGEEWLSPVSWFPTRRHALVEDHGGIPSARHCAERIAAFRGVDTVSFPSRTEVILADHNYTHFRGSVQGLPTWFLQLRIPLAGFTRGGSFRPVGETLAGRE